MSEAKELASPTQEQFEACLRVLRWMRDGGDLDESWLLPLTHICATVRALIEVAKSERAGGRQPAMSQTPEPSTLASAMCYADPTDDPAYQRFVEESAKHCNCQPPHPCPCDGVLAGGICDEMTNEPDYTLDDLDWHEAYD